MIESFNGTFKYTKLTEVEQKQRGILGRLVGPCADFINPTRNSRKYSEQLWENVFNNSLMQEKIKNRCCFGELGHPADRTETDMEKIAICLAEQPKKGDDGKLYGVFDILNTPNGRILKALCDYGCNIGISSRGQGDLITDMDGEEAVDPDTYDCECFDVVLLPGVEAARLKYVTESLDTNNRKGLKLALTESLNSANADERRVMEETLKELNIELTEAVEETEPVKEIWTVVFSDNKDSFEGDVESFDSKDEALKTIKNSDNNMKYALLALHKDGNKDGVADETKVYTSNFTVEEFEPTAEEVVEPIQEAKEDEEDIIETPKEEVASEEEVADEEGEETSEEEPVEDEEEYEEIEDERTDEEIFLDYLASNFEEEKIREVCDILDIEVIEDEETDEDDSDTADEAGEDIELSSEEEANDEESKDSEAVDEGLETLVNSLQEALKSKSDLENTVKTLQEKLAVSDAKVNEINEDCEKYKNAVARLSVLAKSTKDLKESVSKLEESLKEKDATINEQKTRIARLVESRKESVRNSNSLNESVTAKDSEITKLNENLNSVKNTYEDQIKVLNEQIESNKKQNETEIAKLTEGLNKATTLKESYKKLANKAVNKYIEVKADILGLTPTDIKRKLGESYTMEDVDQVCEDLKAYSLNVSKLPFDVNRKVGVRVHESVNPLVNKTKSTNYTDDDVDDSLIRLANSER